MKFSRKHQTVTKRFCKMLKIGNLRSSRHFPLLYAWAPLAFIFNELRASSLPELGLVEPSLTKWRTNGIRSLARRLLDGRTWDELPEVDLLDRPLEGREHSEGPA